VISNKISFSFINVKTWKNLSLCLTPIHRTTITCICQILNRKKDEKWDDENWIEDHWSLNDDNFDPWFFKSPFTTCLRSDRIQKKFRGSNRWLLKEIVVLKISTVVPIGDCWKRLWIWRFCHSHSLSRVFFFDIWKQNNTRHP